MHSALETLQPTIRPETLLEFRLAQLLLLFEVAGVVDHPLGLTGSATTTSSRQTHF